MGGESDEIGERDELERKNTDWGIEFNDFLELKTRKGGNYVDCLHDKF